MSNLLSVSRSDHIALAPLADEILADLTPLAQQNGVSLRAKCDDVCIIGSDALIYRLLFNLVENGIKYNRPGGSVTVSIRQEEAMAVLHVSDTGMAYRRNTGTASSSRFSRIDKSRSRKMGGVGLGLALVREIAVLHGGSVAVESSSDRGTTFGVTLPTEQGG